MIRHSVAVLNESTVLKDTDVVHVVNALQIAADKDFGPAWGTSAKLSFVPQARRHEADGKWQIVVLDDSDQAGALGYHDIKAGQPISFVFAKTDIENGYLWTVTISHELWEMLADPLINLLASDTTGRIYAYENADPVEADGDGFEVAKVVLSNFVYPAWFADGLPGPYDHVDILTEPFQIASGGYMLYTDQWPPNWQELGRESDHPKGSRTERRRRQS